jgi:hypothetical protein
MYDLNKRYYSFLFYALVSGFETFGVSRKFQTGKKAKKVAAATTEQREAYEESMKYSEESQRTQAILEEFKEKRGASLMDRHVAKKAEQPKAVSTGRRAFDRELVRTALTHGYFHLISYVLLFFYYCVSKFFNITLSACDLFD